MPGPFIDADWLRKIPACEDQCILFEQEWPQGDYITKKNCVRARAIGLDLLWLGKAVFTGSALASFLAAVAPAKAVVDATLVTANAVLKAKEDEGKKAEGKAEFSAAIRPVEKQLFDDAAAALWDTGVALFGWDK